MNTNQMNTIQLNTNRRNNKKAAATTILLAVLFVILLAFTSGCGEDSSVTNSTGTGNNTENTSLSVKLDESVTGANYPVITEAKALITEIELETEPSGTSQEIRIAPVVIYFNTGGQVISVTAANLPAGTWNKIKLQIHKPEDTEPIPDPEFREGTSGNQRYSFIIKGTYNGNAFVYKSRKRADIIINLSTPLTTGSSSRNITLLVNPSLWFMNGGNILDPSNSGNDDLIDDNLKNSFKRGFRDDNKDGRPDDN
ncbi:MAG TPA: hypothetical protein PK605_03695 [Ignavibacteria bacterium]|nr:hypothetical protein [Ignavibacteria bacterium]HAX48097.1 hypothetical protein [Bacteroidota bacterium]HRE10901.1 hypothetical protein [Ignavibacteria bacterium]HRF66136.1 hypothetical protein [Ignavibacteria bacterium]HRJ03488.1 hypothetical protein [Ignavibacteria bacterium]